MEEVRQFLLIVSVFQTVFGYLGYYEWTPPEQNRTRLFCPEECQDPFLRNYRPEVECCACRAKPEWEFSSYPAITGDLHIEYVSRRNLGKVVDLHNGYQQYRLIHIGGVLSRLPDNICNFENMIILNLEGNAIKEIGDISCLKNLDTLILKSNQVSTLSNETFQGLHELRVLDLSHNAIVHMEPYSLSQSSFGMIEMDLSHNDMIVLEFSNFLLQKTFCVLDISYNNITNLVNEGGFQIDVNSNEYEDGGMVLLNNNDFETFFDFRSIGVTDIIQLGLVKAWGFDLTGAKWNCDCKMVPFLQKVKEELRHIWRDYFNLTCYEPPHLHGKSIPQLVMARQLDLFVCNLTQYDGCPKHCECTEETNQNRLTVNCESAGLKSMPDLSRLPNWYHVELHLAQNDIKIVTNMDYLNRTTVLDLSGNYLTEISPDAFKSLETNAKHIDISDNSGLNVKNLEFRNIDRCILSLGYKVMTCDCKHRWLSGWIAEEPRRDSGIACNASHLYCATENGNIHASQYSWDCDNSNTTIIILSSIFGCMSLIILVIMYFIEMYRYEVYLLYRYNLRKRGQSTNAKHDIYICTSDTENSQREMRKLRWIIDVLLPMLQRGRYKVFFPTINSDPGSVQNEEIEREMLRSRNYLLILSKEFVEESEDNKYSGTNILSRCHLEWKTAWTYFRSYNDRKIVVINYDHIRNHELKSIPTLRAYIRMRYRVDFSNRNKNIAEEIKRQLGPPMPKKDILGPRKTIFTNIYETELSQCDFEFMPNGVSQVLDKYVVEPQNHEFPFENIVRNLGPQKPKLCFTQELAFTKM